MIETLGGILSLTFLDSKQRELLINVSGIVSRLATKSPAKKWRWYAGPVEEDHQYIKHKQGTVRTFKEAERLARRHVDVMARTPLPGNKTRKNARKG